MLSMSFDAPSMREISLFYGFETLLSPEVQQAMQHIGDLMTTAAQAKTWEVFTAPSGILAGTIAPILNSPYEVQIGVSSPYGRRREEGFSGMTDSLGRFFANDPAKPYLAPTLQENEQAAFIEIEQAAERALRRMGAV